MECISDENRKRLAISQSSIEIVMKKLLDGSISFAEFETLYKLKDKALALCEVSEELQRRINAVRLAFEYRQKERETFMSFHNALTSFWNCCKVAVIPKGILFQCTCACIIEISDMRLYIRREGRVHINPVYGWMIKVVVLK